MVNELWAFFSLDASGKQEGLMTYEVHDNGRIMHQPMIAVNQRGLAKLISIAQQFTQQTNKSFLIVKYLRQQQNDD